VKTARAGSSIALYAGNRCDTKRLTFDARAGLGTKPAWHQLECDHEDTRDLAFHPFSALPYLMSSDGGLHATTDGDAFHLVAGAASGLNALQVTEVHGQYVGDATDPDLYFATQDNKVWGIRSDAPIGSLEWEGFVCDLRRV
jgi:hypothetical protein